MVVKVPRRLLEIRTTREEREKGAVSPAGRQSCGNPCVCGYTESHCLTLEAEQGRSQGIRDCAYMTVRFTLTPMLVGVHSPCCRQCACESGTEGCQCFFPASPEVARTLVPFQEPCSGTQKALFRLLILLSLLGNGPNRAGVVFLTLGQYGLKPVHTPLWAACLHGEWTGGGRRKSSLGRRDCQIPVQCLFFL